MQREKSNEEGYLSQLELGGSRTRQSRLFTRFDQVDWEGGFVNGFRNLAVSIFLS